MGVEGGIGVNKGEMLCSYDLYSWNYSVLIIGVLSILMSLYCLGTLALTSVSISLSPI